MHFLNLHPLGSDQLQHIIDLALEIKADPANFAHHLEGKTLTLLFQKTSTRTRVSAEVAMYKLGGASFFLDWKSTNFALTDLGDESRVLSIYTDFILARLLDNNDLQTLAAGSRVPVINGLCNKFHPLQAISDMMTLKEAFGSLKGLNFTYLGVANNVSNSLIDAALKLGVNLTLAVGEIDPSSQDDYVDSILQAGGVPITTDVLAAVAEADVLYTDTWVNMEKLAADPGLLSARAALLAPFQLNEQLIGANHRQAKLMHCLPAHSGFEIEAGIPHHPQSIMFTQAENRLWSMMAVLIWLNEGLTSSSGSRT